MPPGFNPGDARGEAPCIRKLKTPPSPEGKGGRGIGANNYCYGRQIRQPKKPASPPGAVSATSTDNQPGKPPAGHQQGRFKPVPPTAQVPGHQNAAPRPAPGKPPAGHRQGRFKPVPLPAQAQGCRGRSPLHKKAKKPPFPPGRALCERGVGGMGAGKQAEGRQIRQPKKPAPRRAPTPQA